MIYLGMFAALDELGMKRISLLLPAGFICCNRDQCLPGPSFQKRIHEIGRILPVCHQTTLTKHKKLSEIGLFSLKNI
jgi:hypothetical protein